MKTIYDFAMAWVCSPFKEETANKVIRNAIIDASERVNNPTAIAEYFIFENISYLK